MKFSWSFLLISMVLAKANGQVVSYSYKNTIEQDETCTLTLFEGNSKFESDLMTIFFMDSIFFISPAEFLEEGVFDDIDNIKWSWDFVNQTKNILDFPCKQAVSEFNGRTWVAWYTDTLYGGPWKSKDLPGIILELHDTDSIFNFEAIEFSPKIVDFSLPELKNPISYGEYVRLHKQFRQIMNEGFSNDSLVESILSRPNLKISNLSINFEEVMEPAFFE